MRAVSFFEPGCRRRTEPAVPELTVPEFIEGSRDAPRVNRGVEMGRRQKNTNIQSDMFIFFPLTADVIEEVKRGILNQ